MQNLKIEELTLLVIKHLKDQKKEQFQELINELHPYDIAEVYSSLPDKHKKKFALYMTAKQLAVLIQELESSMQIEVLHHIGSEKSSQVMDLMENDDLADL